MCAHVRRMLMRYEAEEEQVNAVRQRPVRARGGQGRQIGELMAIVLPMAVVVILIVILVVSALGAAGIGNQFRAW